MARILYVITKANWGGAQRYVFDLATAAQAAGHDVAVAYGTSGPLVDALKHARIRSIAIEGLTRDIGSTREFRSFLALIRLLKKERPEVLHVNSSKAGGLGAVAGRIARVPLIIFTAHGWAFNEQRPWWQKILIYKLAWLTIVFSHRTICVSRAILRDTRWMPLIRNKCQVIYNGVSTEGLLSREAARAKLAPPIVAHTWIGMLSELHPTKCVDDAIRAFTLIAKHHPETALIVIGDGEERHSLEDLIRELHMTRRICLLGALSDARMLLTAFDLFVHTSASEALGLALLEAGAASLPVIATKVGGIPEIIPNEDHGLLVPPRDSVALAQAMEALLRDPRRASELGARLKARVTQNFSREKMVAETLSLYR